ncbi:hypothetical protein DIPPA_20717 [Diplonema papillatum]|nr:hypothetical protein DIPPA_20717 [Diplonema papillatum]
MNTDVDEGRQNEGVVNLELGTNFVPSMVITLWVCIVLGLVLDAVIAFAAVRGSDEVFLDYDEDFNFWATNFSWAPVATSRIRVNFTDWEEPLASHYPLRYSVSFSGADERTIEREKKLACDADTRICGPLDLSDSFRQWWQTPFGDPISISFQLLAGTSPEIIDNHDRIRVEVLPISGVYTAACYVLGAILLIFTILTLVKFVYSLYKSSQRIGSDQYLVGILTLLSVCNFYCLFSVFVEGKIESSSTARAYRRFICTMPYIFKHTIQGSVLGLIGYYRPKPFPLVAVVGVWFVIMQTLTLLYVTNSSAYNEDVLDGWWDLLAGNPVGNGDGSKLLAAIYGTMTLVWCLLVIFACAWVFWGSWQFVPYAKHRAVFLKSRVVMAIGLGLIVNYIAGVPASLAIVSPLKGTHLGTCLMEFVLVMSLCGGLTPVFYKDNHKLPPPPTDSSWKAGSWPVTWRKWVAGVPGAARLYMFRDKAAEHNFWAMQTAELADDLSDALNTDWSLCAKRKSQASTRKLWGIALGYLIFSFVWYALFFSWLIGVLVLPCTRKPIITAAKLTRKVGVALIEGVFSTTPGRVPVGIPPVEVHPDDFAHNVTGLTVFMFVYILWFDILFSYWSAWTIVLLVPWGAALNSFVITEPLGAIILSIAEVITQVVVRLQQQWIAYCFLDGIEIRQALDNPEPVPPFSPFCLEDAVTMARVCYEARGFKQQPALLPRSGGEGNDPPAVSSAAGEQSAAPAAAAARAAAPPPPPPTAGKAGKYVALTDLEGAAVGEMGANAFLQETHPSDTHRVGSVVSWGEQTVDVAAVVERGAVRVIVSSDPENHRLVVCFQVTDERFTKEEYTVWKEMEADFLIREKARANPFVAKYLGVQGMWRRAPAVLSRHARWWEAVCAPVLDALRAAFVNPFLRVIITGHGNGAGVAILSSYSISKLLGRHVVSVYAFAAPPLGNAAFREYMLLETPAITTLYYEDDDRSCAQSKWRVPGSVARVCRIGQLLVDASSRETQMVPSGRSRAGVCAACCPCCLGCCAAGKQGGGGDDAPHDILRYQAALSLASCHLHAGLTVPVGEENPDTDQKAWLLHKPAGYPFSIGELVAVSSASDTDAPPVRGRVASYFMDGRFSYVRVRLPYRRAIDVLLQNVSPVSPAQPSDDGQHATPTADAAPSRPLIDSAVAVKMYGS